METYVARIRPPIHYDSSIYIPLLKLPPLLHPHTLPRQHTHLGDVAIKRPSRKFALPIPHQPLDFIHRLRPLLLRPRPAHSVMRIHQINLIPMRNLLGRNVRRDLVIPLIPDFTLHSVDGVVQDLFDGVFVGHGEFVLEARVRRFFRCVGEDGRGRIDIIGGFADVECLADFDSGVVFAVAQAVDEV